MITDEVLRDTLRCWEQTRCKGVSASMSIAADADVSIPLLQAFDTVRGWSTTAKKITLLTGDEYKEAMRVIHSSIAARETEETKNDV
jgi:hypothetical protein